jgi:hypothetical protein
VANGSSDERIARADRIIEQSRKAAEAADQSRKATQNSIANLRESASLSSQARSELDTQNEFVLGKDGVKFRGGSPWALFGFGLLLLVAFIVWQVRN